MSQYLGVAGGVAGAVIGSVIGGPAGALAGLRWGFTIGSIVEGFLARPPSIGDAHFSGASYGTGLNRALGIVRVDCPTIWAQPLSNGTYLTDNGAPGKGKTSGDHYSATFMMHVAETAFTFADGTQIEWPLVINRVWMADMIVWQSNNAEKISDWSSSVLYSFGDYVTDSGSGDVYYSLGNNNIGHAPASDNQASPIWWKLVSVTNTNVDMTVHPQPGESSFTMAADSNQVSSAGVTNTSAYRGCTNLFFNNLDLYQIGNQMPQSASCEVAFGAPAWSDSISYQKGSFASDASGNVYQALAAFTSGSVPSLPASKTSSSHWLYRPPPTWADFLSLECRSAGFSASDLDFSDADITDPGSWSSSTTYGYGAQVLGSDGNYYFSISDTNLDNNPTTSSNQGAWWQEGMFPSPMTGVISNQRMSAEQSISMVMAVNAFDMIQVDGGLTVVSRGGASALTIPLGDLSAALGNDDLPDAIEAAFLNDPLELHSQLEIRFQVLEELYRVGAEKAVRNTVLSHNPSSIDTGICASRAQMAKSAGYMLDTEWTELGGEFKIYLPASGAGGNAYQQLCGTDVITLPWLGTTSRFKIVRTEINDINLIEVTCCIDQQEILLRTEAGSSGTGATSGGGTWPYPVPFWAVSPAQDFTDELANNNGFYVFAGQKYPQPSGGSGTDFGNPGSPWGTPPSSASVTYSVTPPPGIYELAYVGGFGGTSTFSLVTPGGTFSSLPYNLTSASLQSSLNTISAYAAVKCIGGPLNEFPIYIYNGLTALASCTIASNMTGETLDWTTTSASQSWIAGGTVQLGNAVFGVTSDDSGASLTGQLPDASYAGEYDTSSEISAVFPFGSLTEPMTDVALSQVYQGTTKAGLQPGLIGSEIVGVVSGSMPATVLYGQTYYTCYLDIAGSVTTYWATLGTGIYRGLRNSPFTGHSDNEPWAVVNSVSNLFKVPVANSLVGSVVWVLVQAPGQTLADAYQQPVVISGNAKSFVPALVPAQAPYGVSYAISYSGSDMVVTFTYNHGTNAPLTPQTYNWQYSTNGGSTWSSSVNAGASYVAPGISSGDIMARVQAVTQATVPTTSAWVDSSILSYATPPAGGATGYHNDVFTAASGQTVFSLTYNCAGMDVLFWNKVKGINGADYTISGSTLTLSTPASSGDTIDITYAHS